MRLYNRHRGQARSHRVRGVHRPWVHHL